MTGAGQGVGRGISLALADRGYRVALLGRTVAKCESVVSEITERGGDSAALQCDVEHRDQVDHAVAAVAERWGRIDVLVNNAQAMTYASVRKLTEADLDAMWQSGPMGCTRMMQACFPYLRDSRGSVVNLGSGSSVLPQPLMAGYAMAKESIRILSRVSALEWGRFGIRVNVVCPLAGSPGFDSFGISTSGDPTAATDAVTADIPLGRLGDPETDVGRAVAWLCSDEAGYITGTTMMLDGGYNFIR